MTAAAAPIDGAEMPAGYWHHPVDSVSVIHPRTIYISLRSRADFDAIDLPVRDGGMHKAGHWLEKTAHADAVTEPRIRIVFLFWLMERTSDEILRQIRSGEFGT